MSANKHTNKLKLQNYAYEVSDNGVFIHPKETSNVWFQPFTYDNVAHAYYPIPGHGDYPFIEASDIDWRPYKIDGNDVVTSYDLIHNMEVMSSSYWVAGEGVSSIVRVIDQHMGTAAGAYAISEGVRTEASGEAAHAEGFVTTASGNNSHAEGYATKASGGVSHSEGNDTEASGECSHAEGLQTLASGYNSHAEGRTTTASGNYSHAEGMTTTASGNYSHAEGIRTAASGNYSHTEGFNTYAGGNTSHAEGKQNQAWGENSHAEGFMTYTSGMASHSEGAGTVTALTFIDPEDDATIYEINGNVELHENDIIKYGSNFARVVSIDGNYITLSNTLGEITSGIPFTIGKVAYGDYSHAEGFDTKSIGEASHAEGKDTTSLGECSHAEGKGTTASGGNSHAEGSQTTASGENSHTEGSSTIAIGNYSHAEGLYTVAQNTVEHAQGQYNISNKLNTVFGDQNNTIHSIGIGTSTSNRKNAVEVMQNGDMYVINIGNYNGTNFTTSSTLQESLASSTAYAATKVDQIIATGNASYRLLFKYSPNDNPENSYTYYADSIWYNPSNDTLTNKGSAYFATNSGAVGIGLQNPYKKFDVKGQSYFWDTVYIDANRIGAKPHIDLNRVGYNYVNLPSNDGTYFAVSFGTASHVNAKFAVSKTAVFPGRNNNIVDLGTQENYWKNSYVTKYHTPSYEISETSGGRLAIGTHSQKVAAPVNVGNLLVSNAWADYTKVPAMGAYIKGQIRSGIQTGTAPFVVDSTTKVTNLNADFLDGESSFSIRANPNNNGDLIYSWTPYLEAGVRPPGVPSSAGDPILAVGEAPYTYCVGPITGRSILITSNFIPVKAGDTICGEIWGYRESSEDAPLGTFYCGIQRFDRNKNPISSNVGTEYMVVDGATLACDGAWHRYYGSKTLPTSHTPYNGSDGGPVYYIKVYVLVNYKSSGTVTPTWIGGLNFYRTNPLNDNRYVDVSGDTMTGRLQITYNEDVSATGSNGALVVGSFGGLNIGIDNNEIMARNNGAASTLNLNVEGGPIAVGGSITRFYKNASDEPMIALTSNDRDTWLWRINWDTTASSLAVDKKYGFGLKYIGTGSGNDNSLVLYADNQAGTQVKAVEVKQNGATYTYQNIYALSYVTLGNSNTADRTTVTSVLNVDGNTTIAGYLKANAYVTLGNSTTADRTTVTSVLNVDGNTTIAGYLKANAYVTLGNSTTADRTTVTSVLNVDGNTTIKDGSYLKALGNVTLGNSTTADTTTVASILNIEGNTTIKDGSYLKALGNVTLGNSTTADTTTVTSVLNIDGNTTIKDGSYLKALGNVTLGNAASDTTTVASILNIESNTTIKDNAYFKAFGNVTLGNSTTADTTLVNSVLNAQADITAVGYIRTNSKNAYIGTPGDQCHLQYDNSTKCIKFIFD